VNFVSPEYVSYTKSDVNSDSSDLFENESNSERILDPRVESRVESRIGDQTALKTDAKHSESRIKKCLQSRIKSGLK
jgi:hypothetical protein